MGIDSISPDGERPSEKIEDYLNRKGFEKPDFPERLDWMATRVVSEGSFVLKKDGGGFGIDSNEELIDSRFRQGCDKVYKDSLAATLNIDESTVEIPDKIGGEYVIGNLVYKFTNISRDLEDIPGSNPGQALAQYINKKQSERQENNARYYPTINTDAGTPRELIQQIAYDTENSEQVYDILNNANTRDIEEELAKLKLSDSLWGHQYEALDDWVNEYDEVGYVKMATATGKTVLGISAIACTASQGSDWTHHSDDPIVTETTCDDFLVVIDNDILKNQWMRMLKKHCHIPEDYAEKDGNIFRFPWGSIKFKNVQAVEQKEAKQYDLVIFDELHEYEKKRKDLLTEFVNSQVKLLGLSATVDENLDSLVGGTEADLNLVKKFTIEDAQEAGGIIADFDWEVHYTPVLENSPGLKQLRKGVELWNEWIVRSGTNFEFNDLDRLIEQSSDDTNMNPEEVRSELQQQFETVSSLVSSIQNLGGTNRSEILDIKQVFQGYRQHWWNLRPNHEKIISLIEQEISELRPCIVITKSYSEAKSVGKKLEQIDNLQVIKLIEPNQSENDNKVHKYNNSSAKQKVIIGPRGTIGKGTDLPSAEVGINISDIKKGVNDELIQILGRILRRSDSKATFYNLKPLPERELLLDIDSEDIIREICEFRAQGSEDLNNEPLIRVDEKLYPEMNYIESKATEFLEEQNMTPKERVLMDRIKEDNKSSDQVPVVTKFWGRVDSTSDPNEEANKQTVEIDPVISALIMKELSSDQISPQVIESIIETYLDTIIKKGADSVTQVSIPSEDLSIELDPLFAELIEIEMKDSEYDELDAFVRHCLHDSLDIPDSSKRVQIQNYEKFQFIINTLVDDQSNQISNLKHIVELAVLKHLNLIKQMESDVINHEE